MYEKDRDTGLAWSTWRADDGTPYALICWDVYSKDQAMPNLECTIDQEGAHISLDTEHSSMRTTIPVDTARKLARWFLYNTQPSQKRTDADRPAGPTNPSPQR